MKTRSYTDRSNGKGKTSLGGRRGKGLTPVAGAGLTIRLQTILVPVDFSEHTRKALHYAQAFAAQFGAKIVLVHVVEPTVVPDNFGIVPPAYDEMNGVLMQTAQQRLGQLALETAGNKLIARPIVATGRAPWEIVRIARETEADLIIVTTHGYTGLKHVLLGSTAELIIRHAPCPVLTVRQVEHDFVEAR